MKRLSIFLNIFKHFQISPIHAVFTSGCVVTLAIFLFHFYMVGFGVYGDGMGYYAQLRSFIFDGNFNISNEYRYYANTASQFGGGVRYVGEIPQYSKYTIGLALILLPFFLFGHGFAIVLHEMGIPVSLNGLSWPYELWYCMGSLILGSIGLIFCFQGARRLYDSLTATLAVVGIWFASPLFYYLCIESSMSHAVSQCLISIFLFYTLHHDWLHKRTDQFILGLVLGLAILVRPQNILFAIVPLCQLFFLSFQKDDMQQGHKFLACLFVGLTALLLIIPQAYVYKVTFEHISSVPYFNEGTIVRQSGSFDWLHPKVFSVLFSGFHGLFAWHPITLLSFIGLIVSIRKTPWMSASLLIGFLLQVYLIASWWAWWQGASLGGRMFSNCSYIFVVGLTALFHHFHHPRVKRVAVLIVGLCIIWNVLLILQYKSAMIPPEGAPMSQIIKNQFRALPFFLEHIFNR